ncbi:uncharacterized protein LOC129594198 isoform X2 [Paramacrobiotus metropolitanus]|uniref:uncharacterized protein LOC129594198 isoform X2 n=1 Tax=Paramacrobiotus metropolitanus TaxID=2943436 RepID=UPI00244654E6|nr:uncharacterized protein LOC129594198 isoform X2 [Paramacrobiotus metropolitanus]
MVACGILGVNYQIRALCVFPHHLFHCDIYSTNIPKVSQDTSIVGNNHCVFLAYIYFTMSVKRVWRIIPLWIAFIVQSNYLSADDSFMCCMSGWKSVRGVVLCPRPCCEGYALRSSILPALGPVTTCELQNTPGDIPPAVPAKPIVSAATPQSPGPVNIPIIALNEDSDIPLSRIPPPARQRGHNRRVRPLSAAVQASLEAMRDAY